MSTFSLKDVFDEISKNNIFVNLDDSYYYTSKRKPSYKTEEYIGYLDSSSKNKEEIDEALREEGSTVIVYRFIPSTRSLYKNTLLLLLHSIFNKFNYEPYIVKNKKNIEIELVISKEDLPHEYKSIFDVKSYENEDENEDENKDEDENEDENKDEYENEDEDDNEDKDDVVIDDNILKCLTEDVEDDVVEEVIELKYEDSDQ